jgi:hypothetical protein
MEFLLLEGTATSQQTTPAQCDGGNSLALGLVSGVNHRRMTPDSAAAQLYLRQTCHLSVAPLLAGTALKA